MKHFSRFSIALVLFCATDAAALAGPKNPDIAFAMGMLWRVQDNICPGISFDPAILAATTQPKPMTAEMLKSRFRQDFDKGFAMADEAITGGDATAYCQSWVTDFFGGRKSIFGTPLPAPGKPAAGLRLP